MRPLRRDNRPMRVNNRPARTGCKPGCCGPAAEWYRFKVCACQTGGAGPNLANYYILWADVVGYYEAYSRPIPECPVGKPDGKCAIIDRANPGVGTPTGIRYNPGVSFPLLDSCCECCAFTNLASHCCWAEHRTSPSGPLVSGVGAPPVNSFPGFEQTADISVGQHCCYSRVAGTASYSNTRYTNDISVSNPVGSLFIDRIVTATATMVNGVVSISGTRQQRSNRNDPFTVTNRSDSQTMPCTGVRIPSERLAWCAKQLWDTGTFAWESVTAPGGSQLFQGHARNTASCHAFAVDADYFVLQETQAFGTIQRERIIEASTASIQSQEGCEGCAGELPELGPLLRALR